MLTALWVILGAFAVLVALLLCVVLLPVRVWLQAEAGKVRRFRLDVQVLGGATPRFRLVDSARSARKPQPRREKRPPSHSKRRRRARGRWLASRGPRMTAALPSLVAGLLRRIHLDRLTVDGTFGLADPADTGRLYGLLTPLIYACPSGSRSVSLRPDFSGPAVSGRAEASLRVVPGALAIPLLGFAWQVFVADRWP